MFSNECGVQVRVGTLDNWLIRMEVTRLNCDGVTTQLFWGCFDVVIVAVVVVFVAVAVFVLIWQLSPVKEGPRKLPLNIGQSRWYGMCVEVGGDGGVCKAIFMSKPTLVEV